MTQLNPINVDRIVTPHSTEEIGHLVANHKGPISVGGGRYSQGGQISTKNALFLEMRGMNKISNIDVENQKITVEAGATWREIQEAIDPKGLSIKIMQTYANFTVGGVFKRQCAWSLCG